MRRRDDVVLAAFGVGLCILDAWKKSAYLLYSKWKPVRHRKTAIPHNIENQTEINKIFHFNWEKSLLDT